MNECITSKKKPPKLYKGQHFFKLQLARGAPVLEAGGKPSTRFPPEGLVELHFHTRSMWTSSYDFLIEKSKFSKNHENVTFSKFYQNLEVTFNISLVEQIDRLLYHWS